MFFNVLALYAQNAAELYIEKFKPLAIEVSVKYHIPVSLILGIALHESASGTSKICVSKNNHFGVKGRVKSSKTKSGYTTAFRKFETDEASYQHIGELISKRKYYPALKGNLDYLKWLKAIKASGYARSPSWISVIDKTIKRYNLTRFDIPYYELITPLQSPRNPTILVK